MNLFVISLNIALIYEFIKLQFQIKEFDRVDSEDDILGEYREECKIGTGCLRKRTGLEKCFGGCIVVLLILTLALIIALAQRKSGPGKRVHKILIIN